MTSPVDRDDDLDQARALGVETCGRIAKFWGFTRTMGRAFGLLYLSPEPLTQPELQRRLGVSVGNASMTLAALERWGVVARLRRRGERRDRFAAETDFWKMIAGVINRRERREIRAAVAAVGRAEALARARERKSAGRRRQEAVFARRRLERLHDICALGETMLDMLLGDLTLDVARFRHVLGGGRDAGDRGPRAGFAAASQPPGLRLSDSRSRSRRPHRGASSPPR